MQVDSFIAERILISAIIAIIITLVVCLVVWRSLLQRMTLDLMQD